MNKLRELIDEYEADSNVGNWLNMQSYILNHRNEIAGLIDAANGLSNALAEFGVYPAAIYEKAEWMDAALAKLEY